jgi:hypothetical protein
MNEHGGNQPDKTAYETHRRYRHKRANKDLSGFALDWTIRFNHQQSAFLDDQNGGDAMVFNDLGEISNFIREELERHHAEFFGA